MQAVRVQPKLSGREKAAVLLLTLGTDKAVEIYKHLKEDEIEQLTLEIANIGRVDDELKEEVIKEFYEICVAQKYIVEGGIEYAREILERALGPEKTMELIGRITSSLQVRPFDFIRKTDPTQLFNFLQNEQPQTIALVLSYITPKHAAAVISALPPEKQALVAKKIATMERTSPEFIKEVERILEKKVSSLGSSDYTFTGGVEAVVEILNSADRGTEKNILETLQSSDNELADEIKKRMFVFEDIVKLDNRGIQRFLKEVENNDLCMALKGSTEEVERVIFNNMSTRLREMLKEDIEFMGPVRLIDVEEAQQKIVNIIRWLEEENEIIISRGGGDEVIV